MQNANRELLEGLIDAVGVSDILETMSEICYEKAEHLETNWQDYKAAKWWLKIAGKLQVFSISFGKLLAKI